MAVWAKLSSGEKKTAPWEANPRLASRAGVIGPDLGLANRRAAAAVQGMDLGDDLGLRQPRSNRQQ